MTVLNCSIGHPNITKTHRSKLIYIQISFIWNCSNVLSLADSNTRCQGIFFHNQKTQRQYIVLIHLSFLLICHSSDVELNPGPPKFQCSDCSRACTWNPKKPVIACDSCDIWCHKACIGLSSEIFMSLARSDASWICCNCGLPNYSSSLFTSFDIDCEHSYDPLSDQSWNSSMNSTTTIWEPLHCSSPKTKHEKVTRKNNIRVLVTNRQSNMSKKESLWETIDSSQPDIICASETWLSDKISNSEFICHYDVHRNIGSIDQIRTEVCWSPSKKIWSPKMFP